jgi:hypothetical protein
VTGIGDNFQLHTLLADPLTGDPAREARVHAVAVAVAPGS